MLVHHVHVRVRSSRVVSTGKCLVAGAEIPTLTLRAGVPHGIEQLVLRLETLRDLRFWVGALVSSAAAAILAIRIFLFRMLSPLSPFYFTSSFSLFYFSSWSSKGGTGGIHRV